MCFLLTPLSRAAAFLFKALKGGLTRCWFWSFL